MAAQEILSTDTTAIRRRVILTSLATALPAVALAQDAKTPVPATVIPASPSLARSVASADDPCQFLNPHERLALTALVDRIIPADDLGPGAVEAQVVVFLDRQLAGAWGSGAHFYRSGPFEKGTPQQGYQLPLTPAELFREGLARLNEAAAKQHGHGFAECAPEQQEAMMTAMQDGKLDLQSVPANLFFNAVVDATVEGFFSDPMYGGNKDMIGWKLVGFPGSYASYAQEIERHGLDWRRPPVPITADLDIANVPGMPGQICVTR